MAFSKVNKHSSPLVYLLFLWTAVQSGMSRTGGFTSLVLAFFCHESGYGFFKTLYYICIKNSNRLSVHGIPKFIGTDVSADEVSLIWSREGHLSVSVWVAKGYCQDWQVFWGWQRGPGINFALGLLLQQTMIKVRPLFLINLTKIKRFVLSLYSIK